MASRNSGSTTGLAIAFSTPLVTYIEIDNPDIRDKLMLFQGVFHIRNGRYYKNSTCSGFLYVVDSQMENTFLTSLLLLIGVTKTMFNGLENYFVYNKSTIEDETIIQTKMLDLENQIFELDKEKEELKM